MLAPTAYADDIRRWCARMNCAPDNNPEMVRDYIDSRWSDLNRSTREKIFKAAMRPASV